jgi:hypothetical protein
MNSTQWKEEFMDRFAVDYHMQCLKEQLDKFKKEISPKCNLSVPYLRQLRTEIVKCHDELKNVIDEHIQKSTDIDIKLGVEAFVLPTANFQPNSDTASVLQEIQDLTSAVTKAGRDQRNA